MPKINQEEYEILKDLDKKWKWIARDKDGVLGVYDAKVVKTKFHNFWIMAIKNKIDLTLFSFIQWEDEEPYNIAELIEEYKYSAEHVSHLVNERVKALGKAWSESEETEVKTLESIREEIWEEMLRLEDKRIDQWADIKYQTLREVLQKLGHLDEPEVLSQEWIKDNLERKGIHFYVNTIKLQNLLVPKQEDINKEEHEAYVKGFEAGEKQTVEFYEEHESKDFNKKVNQLIKAIENPKRIKLRDVIERMDVLSEKNRNDWIERVNKRYEVEEEQKYYVLSKELHPMLCESAGTDKKIIESTTQLTINEKRLYKEQYALTEQEIKDYDERFWPFAVKVEELEE